MWKNGIWGIGPPLTFSKISPARGPWSWRRKNSRPLGLFAVRWSSRRVTSYEPVSAWNCTQFSTGGRPTSRTWFSARQNRMPSPIM
jgi:hypothetical protein